MIKADKAQAPSRHVLTRAKTMRIDRIGPTEFKVTPTKKGKTTRIVRFLRDFDEHGSVYIECYDEKTMKDCPANSCNCHCSHVERAIAFLLEGA